MQNYPDLVREVRETLGGLLVASAKVWMPANLIIYNVPLELRVIASNVVDIAWAAICSNMAADCGSGGATATNDVCVVATAGLPQTSSAAATEPFLEDDGLGEERGDEDGAAVGAGGKKGSAAATALATVRGGFSEGLGALRSQRQRQRGAPQTTTARRSASYSTTGPAKLRAPPNRSEPRPC